MVSLKKRLKRLYKSSKSSENVPAQTTPVSETSARSAERHSPSPRPSTDSSTPPVQTPPPPPPPPPPSPPPPQPYPQPTCSASSGSCASCESFADASPEEAPKERDSPAQELPEGTIHASQVVQGVAVAVGVAMLLLMKLIGNSGWEVTLNMLMGFVVGMGVAFKYYYNVKRKEEARRLLSVNPGVKGTTLLFGEPPTWLSYTSREKAQWLNKMLSEMWPYYDRAICDSIKEILEPIMEDVRPPIFKFIGFKKLTFGDVPFKIEGVSVEQFEEEIQMDIDFRWCGDSNITLSIEPNLPGDVTRMAPTLSHISLVGKLRITFKPLLSKVPCIGAMVFSLLSPPKLNFKIDVGKALGGNAVGSTVKKALGPFIKDTLMNMLVWPKRYVVPIMYEEDTGPLDSLQLHSVGLLRVEIVEAKGLPAADMGGTSDPVVEVFTEINRKFKTKVIKSNLNPRWQGEVKYLFVQEPRSQYLRVNVYDVDVINARSLMKGLNVIKNLKEMIGAEELLGRTQILIQPMTAKPKAEVDDWYDLGMGDWASVHGTGSGSGQIRLKTIYTPFSELSPTTAALGGLIVKIYRCRNLVPRDTSGTSDPYIKLKVNSKSYQTYVIRQNLNPEFHLTYEWWDVPVNEGLKLKVYDKDFGPQSDDFMGELYLSISDIARSVDADGCPGIKRQWYQLQNVEHGEIELFTRFVPFN